MRPLVAVRRAASFDANFLDRSPLLWPLTRAARDLGRLDDFPSVDALERVFEGRPPVRFVPAQPRRRRREAVDPHALYDGRIAIDGQVPTRPSCWHDLMNALVWGTFPRAKRALHARQYRAIAERIDPGARALPGARSRELDALALLDEGGLIVLARDAPSLHRALRNESRGTLAEHVASGSANAIVFGHAIYESLVLGVTPAVVATIVLERREGRRSVVDAADGRLADAIADSERLRTPTELVRVDVHEATP